MKSLVIVLLATSVAHAEEPDRVASVTWSPIHLVLPVVELTAEFKPMSHFGIAAIGGVGSIGDSMGVSGRAIEVGGQLNYYPMRPFAGLDLGVEVLYASIDNVNVDTSAAGDGLAIGPLVGYKGMFGFGLTLVAQVGFEVIALHAHSSSAMESKKDVIPLVNLNVGWSF